MREALRRAASAEGANEDLWIAYWRGFCELWTEVFLPVR